MSNERREAIIAFIRNLQFKLLPNKDILFDISPSQSILIKYEKFTILPDGYYSGVSLTLNIHGYSIKAFANFLKPCHFYYHTTDDILFLERYLFLGFEEDRLIAKIRLDGLIKINIADEIEITFRPDGIQTTRSPNGTETILRPDGTTSTIAPDGVQTTSISDGFFTFYLPNAANVASIVSLILAIVALWPKKTKNNKTGQSNKPHQSINKMLDEVKGITVLMSDGTRVSFESWLSDPDEVIKFIEKFHSLPASPSPLQVTLILKKKPYKMVIPVSDNTEVQEKLLDEVIKYITENS